MIIMCCPSFDHVGEVISNDKRQTEPESSTLAADDGPFHDHFQVVIVFVAFFELSCVPVVCVFSHERRLLALLQVGVSNPNESVLN